MENNESILIQIGEFVLVEMGGVKDVTYDKKEADTKSSFTMTTDNEEKFIVTVESK